MTGKQTCRRVAMMMILIMIGGLFMTPAERTSRANAAAPLFGDGFEDSFGEWTVFSGLTSTPTQSSYRVHNGKYSYAVDEAKDAIQHNMAANTNKVVSVWFYDDADNTTMNVMAFADRNITVMALGVRPLTSTTHYTYRIGNTHTATTVGRSTGWHNLVFDYRSGTGVTVYIDETQVGSSNLETSFNRIVLGNLWDTAAANVYFDDVSVQDDLPWTVFTPPPTPTPAPAQSFYLNEGFESGFANWKVKYSGPSPSPLPSTAQAHSGTNSYGPSLDQDAIEYAWLNKPSLNKVAVIRFYDDAADTSLRVMAFADRYLSAMAIVGLGVNTDVSGSHYVYRIGTDDTASTVARTTGWHSLAFDYRSGSDVTLYIDGTAVITSTAETALNRIALGDWWDDGHSGNVYFDDVTTQDYLPGETPVTVSPSPTPTPTPTPAPPLRPVDGVWISDSFESGFGQWTTTAGTPGTSTAQSRSGANSFVLDEDMDAITLNLAPSLFKKVAVVWFYDDAADTTLNAHAYIDNGSTVIGLGVQTVTSTTSYTYRNGGNIIATSVARTTGWHSFVFDYRSGTGVTLYIDGVEVTHLASPTAFNKIFLGDVWSGSTGTVYFDDISVQDYLPWNPPLPAGVSFQDGFENGFDQWTAVYGTPAAASLPVHGGDYSFAVDQDQVAIQHIMPAKTNQVVVAWFYDDAADTTLNTFAFADRNANVDSIIGLGVDTTTSTSEYVYRIGTVKTAGGVARTTGWHSFSFDYRTGADVSLYIDGTLVATTAAETSFLRIALGDYWSGSTGNVHFDDVSVQRFLPHEAYPFATPPAPVIEAAMGFEAAGDWRTEAYLLEDNPTFIPDDLLSSNTHPLDPQGELAYGYALSAANVRQGNYSIKWDNHPYYPTLSTRNVQRDWSTSNMISFWAYSAAATREEIALVVHSDHVVTPYKDFFYYWFQVDWTGWKKIEIPLAAFTSYGSETAGWNNVQQLSFVTKMFNK